MGRKPKDSIVKKVKHQKLKKIIQAPKGMPDILPEDDQFRRKIYKVAHEVADYYGFGKVELPIAEETNLFLHGTGATSEIVQRQMFSFKTPGGDQLSLRPEFTPNLMRVYLEKGFFNLPKPVKLFTYGPLFRYEQPQRGRYRQFWQYDFEVIGDGDPIYDALTIQLMYNTLNDLKIKNLLVEVNTIGCDNCRPIWRKNLKNYFHSKLKKLCSDCQRRYKNNILRILDCKSEQCQPIKENAPKMIDYLCHDCRSHFKSLLEYLEELQLPYEINHRLVRGLDYYTKTVFEIRETDDNLALCGGGRYDYLVEILGGRPTPAVGAAVGVERLVEILKNKQTRVTDNSQKNRLFLIILGEQAKKKGLGLMETLRKANINVAESFGKDSLKAQLRQADKMNSPFVLIMGQKEAIDNTVIFRDMKSGVQELINIDNIGEELKKHIKNFIV